MGCGVMNMNGRKGTSMLCIPHDGGVDDLWSQDSEPRFEVVVEVEGR